MRPQPTPQSSTAPQSSSRLPPITFADVEAPMGDVPALGQHTEALLVESGLDAETAQDLIGRGVATQAESFHPARPSS